MSKTTVTVGDVIRALEDDSIGKVLGVSGQTADVAWEGGVRTTYQLDASDYEVYATVSDAETAREDGINARGTT